MSSSFLLRTETDPFSERVYFLEEWCLLGCYAVWLFKSYIVYFLDFCNS
jgi:hypothetical protein